MTHARLAIYKRTGTADTREIMENARSGFLPILQKQDGFVDYELVDAGDQVISISHWESEGSAEKATQQAANWVKENLADKVQLEQNLVGDVGVSSKRERSPAAD